MKNQVCQLLIIKHNIKRLDYKYLNNPGNIEVYFLSLNIFNFIIKAVISTLTSQKLVQSQNDKSIKIFKLLKLLIIINVEIYLFTYNTIYHILRL